MPQDRRQFLRHPIRVPVQFRVGSKDGPFKSQTADLSEGGLRFYWHEAFPAETVLEIRIPVADRLFKLSGTVVYSVRENSPEGFFRTGVCFKEPMMAFRLKLAEEIMRIQKFRERISSMVGRKISEEEAASKWIKKYAEKFAKIYQT